MAGINDLLANAQAQFGNLDILPPAGTPQVKQETVGPALDGKKSAVSDAVAAKKTAMGGELPSNYDMAVGALFGNGSQNMSELESDIRTANTADLYRKYGNDANLMNLDRAQAAGEVLRDSTSETPGFWRTIGDDATSLGLGGVNALGGLAALGTGLVSNEGGAAVAGALSDFNEFARDTQSQTLKDRSRVLQARNTLDSRDSTAQMEIDAETDGDFLAGLKRVGRDVVSSFNNALENETTYVDGTLQALGSLLAVPVVGKGVGAVGNAIVPQATQRGVGLAAAMNAELGTVGAANVLAAAGRSAPTMASIGLIEGGGAYQQIAADIMGRDHETLMAESPEYRELIAQGVDPEEAKSDIASRTGLLAAGITAPLAALTGSIVGRFEAAPTARASLAQLASTLVREPVEEAIQGGTSQIAQNFAERQIANENQDLTEGVGQQIGEGAVYGLGMTAAIQAPNAAREAGRYAGMGASKVARATVGGLGAVGDAANSALAKRAAEVDAANNAASPVSDTVVRQAASDLQASTPVAEATVREAVETMDAAPEVKAQANAYVDNLLSASEFDPVEIVSASTPQAVVDSVIGSANRVEAIQRLADFVARAPENSREQLGAGFALHSLLLPYENIVNSDPVALESLSPDSPAAAIVAEFNAMADRVQATPKVMAALQTINAAVERMAQAQQVEITPQNISTPEVQTQVSDAIKVAEIAPEKGNLETNQQILFQVQQGNLQVTPEQKAALDTSVALLRAVKAADDEAVRLGKANKVSLNITSEDGAKGKSVTQHAQGIMAAYKAGNTNLAAARLFHLREFAQNMQNKVDALNTHLAGGDPTAPGISYQALSPALEWYESPQKLTVNPGQPRSVQFAQQVAGEAKLLSDVYNGMVTAFPDLNLPPIQGSVLNEQLNQPVRDVVAAYRLAQRQASQPVTTEPTPVQEQSVTPAPVEAPAPAITSEVVDRVSRMTDGQLNDRLHRTDINDPLYDVLDAEMTRREDAAQAANEEAERLENQSTEVVEDAVVEEPVAEVQPEPEVEATPAPKGMAAVYPDLVGSTNYFRESFSLPENQRTRTIGVDNPLTMISDAMKSSASLTELMGESLTHDFTPEVAQAYQGLLDQGEGIKSALGKNLNTFLDSKYNKDKTIRQAFEDGEEVQRWVRGKALNIVENVDGNLRYNSELIENAVLAGLQWLITADQLGSVLDTKDVADITGVPEVAVSDLLMEQMNEGMSVVEAKRSLAQKIANYWGVERNQNGYIGYQEGIPEAIAAEILTVLMDSGAIERKTIELDETNGLPEGEVKTIDRLVPMVLPSESPLREFPSAIEQAVLTEPEEVSYIGEGSIPPVARTQLRNPMVENTAEQLRAIENEQNTPYYVNTTMSNLYSALGVDNIVKMFGAGRFDPEAMNRNHAQSLEGVNRSVVAAFNHLTGVVAETSNVAGQAGTALDQTPIHYAFNMTRVGRLQMLGKYNPQANKLVREAILPTRSTLDLSSENTDDFRRFMQGAAQALGVKVHKMSVAKAVDKTKALLEGALAQSVEAAQAVIGETTLPDNFVDGLVDNFRQAGVELSPVALHALTEYARYKSDPSATFTTSLYLEADGMTNGPINAMNLFTSGPFTPSQITNVAKGGLFFNRGAETANNNNELVDPKDLYQATTDRLKEYLETQRKEFAASNPDAANQLNNLLNMMDLFLAGDLQFDGQNLVLQRGIAKNPLTITIYGSGADGIAGKLTKTIVDAIYERMSQVSTAMAANPELSVAEAMFGPQSVDAADAQAKMDRFRTSLNSLIGKQARVVKGNVVFETVASTRKKQPFNPQEFTFEKIELTNMQSNMLRLFVDPMRSAITDTVGEPLMESAEILRQATQVQSIVLEHAFRTELEAALEAKKKDKNWRNGDFLTQREVNGIYDKLSHLSPMIETGTQTFFVAGSQSTDIGVTEFGRGLNDKLRTPAYIYGPADAGVAGIPFLNIGAGDGQMMQSISTDPNAPTGTLKIFDGMNMPLDQIESGSEVSNKAVFDSWMRNPLADVHKSYAAFMNDADLTNMPAALRKSLVRSLYPPKMWETDVPSDVLRSSMQELVGRLDIAQKSIEARHRVLNRVQVSVDQMAAAASPYVRQGDLPLFGSSPEAIADQLNGYYALELDNILDSTNTKSVLKSDIVDLGVKTESGAVVMDQASLKQLSQKVNIPAHQQEVFSRIVDSLAAEDYKVVFGLADQLSVYAEDNGLNGLKGVATPAGRIDGYTTFGDKTIYLTNPSSETLVHELIHASTYGNVLAHYEGTATPEVSGAVTRIEALMDQFLGLEDTLSQVSPSVAQSYSNAVATIRSFNQDSVGKASALNEFMAWVLANEDLSRIAERTKASKLAQIASKLMDVLRAMFGISKRAGVDMLSNLKFNSAIIISSQPSLSTRLNDTVTFQNDLFGDNDRLTEVMDTYSQVIGRYLEEPLQAGVTTPSVSVSDAIMSSYRIARSFQSHGFRMNMQESSAFNHIVTALATEAQIDPNSMAQAQKIYAEVTKQLTVESFMNDPEGNNPADRYYAQEKYDVLTGKYRVEYDSKGRSTLLPAFLALATVNQDFRNVLANMDMPKSVKSTAEGVDGLLENLGTKAMDSLSAKMSGTTKAKTVVEGIDALNKHLADQVQARESFIDQMASTPGGIVDRANEIVIDGANRLASALLDNAKRAEQNNSNRLTRLTANFGAGLAAVISEQTGQHVAQGVMSAMNRMNAWKPFHDFINDVVGRTESNANVYDMIKGVRTMVQQVRQQFREHLPELIESKFSTPLRDDQWTSLTKGLAKTDISSLSGTFSQDQILNMLSDSKALDAEVTNLENSISQADPQYFRQVQKKAVQLATFMNTGVPGSNLLRNAHAVANLFGENKGNNWTTKNDQYVSQVDQLVSLYALQDLNQVDKDSLAELARGEVEGMKFVMSYLDGQRQEEQRKTVGKGLSNGYKGYIPSEPAEGMSLIVADDAEFSKLSQKSYVRVADYVGSRLDRRQPKGYYFAPVATRAGFEQGIMQNVRMTASGVDAVTGYTAGQTAGRITEPTTVKQLARAIANGQERGKENLLPVFDEAGNVIAYERSLDPVQLERLEGNTSLSRLIGQWRGRQVEEAKAQFFNEKLIDSLKAMYNADIKESRQDEYVDLLGDDVDPVVKDAMSLMTRETRAYIESQFGDQFLVRKDMLNDAIGYRSASVGDAWSGNTRWSPKTQEVVRNLATSVFGNKAYQTLVNAEKTIQNVVSDAKVLIVVKSVVVPMVNLMSNVYQLASRGVPLGNIARSMPKKTAEIDAYVNSRIRMIEAEAELRAATGNPREERRLRAEIQTISDGHKRMSIWPLIEAGEFSSVSDVDLKRTDRLITSGRMQEYIENKVNQLPKPIANLGRYALITKDTALFQGLQKTVEYGDFLAKAILFDDLTKRQKKSKKEALGRVTEEFVNYDRLSGRFRGYLESMGLLWFYNFKIRSAKIAMSMIRNNPVHTLLATLAPAPTFFGTVGLPTEDNIFSKLADGSLDYSVGPSQGLNSINLNPWVNLSN